MIVKNKKVLCGKTGTSSIFGLVKGCKFAQIVIKVVMRIDVIHR